MNPALLGADVPAVAYLQDGEVIGHLAIIAVNFWNGRAEVAGHCLKGFMVLPEHQNRLVGFAVLEEMLKHVNISATMTVALPAMRLFQAVGFAPKCHTPLYDVAKLRSLANRSHATDRIQRLESRSRRR